MSLKVRVVARAEEVPAELWALGFAPPLEGVWWYRGLEQSGLDDQFTFSYAIVEDQGRPLALAPLFLADIPIELVVPDDVMPVFRAIGRVWKGAMHQRTLFVGSPFSDEGGVGFLEGVEHTPALLAIAKALPVLARQAKAWMMVWKDFPKAVRPEMQAMADAEGFFPSVSYPGTIAIFPTRDKADFIATLKASHRHNFKKRLKRSAILVELRTEVVQHPRAAVLDEIMGLFRQTFEKSETKFERLDRRYFEVFAALPQTHFVTLRAPDGAMVAFMLCLVSGEVVINKFIGIDYARDRDWALYFRLWDTAADWALSIGARALQSGQTGYRPKVEMGHCLTPLWNYARHRNLLVHAVYGLVGRQISWATLDPYLGRLDEA